MLHVEALGITGALAHPGSGAAFPAAVLSDAIITPSYAAGPVHAGHLGPLRKELQGLAGSVILSLAPVAGGGRLAPAPPASSAGSAAAMQQLLQLRSAADQLIKKLGHTSHHLPASDSQVVQQEKLTAAPCSGSVRRPGGRAAAHSQGSRRSSRRHGSQLSRSTGQTSSSIGQSAKLEHLHRLQAQGSELAAAMSGP